ncbi:MAG: transposase [Terracidiphilus sp.]|jgi:transposase-like protein
MNYAGGKRAARRPRVYRSVAEKRRIVELTFSPGASVSLVAQAEGVNSHQVFDWRRAYRNGKLAAGEQEPCKLLPVIMSASDAGNDAGVTAEESIGAIDAGRAQRTAASSAHAQIATSSIHIELPGRATIRVENGVNAALLRAVLESLRP